MLVVSAVFGGVIGSVVAGTLEYDALWRLGVLPMLLVAVIEEAAKLVVPVVLLVWALVQHRRQLPSDGVMIGIAAGAGVAALETMGYAFTALIASHGSLGRWTRPCCVAG